MRGGKKNNKPIIGDILYEYIETKKSPVNYQELIAVVQEKRDDLHSLNLGSTIRSVLQRQPRFIRISPGKYDIEKPDER